MAVLVLLSVLVSLVAAGANIVKTSNGTVQGGQCPQGNLNYFYGIPFADPPIGELRLQAPRSYSGSYNGTLDGTLRAPSCYQFGTSDPQPGTKSEDCLHLDVYVPSNVTTASALPVRVWIYGGAFETGGSDSPLYNGCSTSGDAVVFVINYRIGPLGYLTLENSTLKGNYGLQDQVLALQWIQDNAKAFGGDPNQVLVYGESAGAISSFILATLPEATSLMRAVAMESGGGVDLATVTSAQPYNERFVAALGCATTDIACIRTTTASQMNDTYNTLPGPGNEFAFTLHDRNGSQFPWGPKVGGPLLPVQPSSGGVRVPAIFGSNGFEGSLFVLGRYGVAGSLNLTETDYESFLITNFGSPAPQVGKQYPLTAYNNSAYDAMSIVVRDSLFRCTALRGANAAVAKGLPAWTYIFNQTPTCPFSPQLPASVLPLIGATHSSDVIYSFGETSGLPAPGGNCTLSPGEVDISNYMQRSWTSMAASGQPVDSWPRHSANETMGVTFQDGVTPGPLDYSMCAFWDGIEKALLAQTPGADGTSAGNGSDTSGTPAIYQGAASGMRASKVVLAMALVCFVIMAV